MDDGVLKDQALALWMKGQKHHLRGDFDGAIELYTKSLALYPTAEAYTFRGWAYSFQGRLDEAIEWLEKAKTAPRYEPRHFPYMNLGRIYAQKGMVLRAIQEFEAALEIHAGEPTCLSALGQLRGALN